MYGEIVFYTHGSTIEYGGEIFAAGELTADILNFAPEDYRPIQPHEGVGQAVRGHIRARRMVGTEQSVD